MNAETAPIAPDAPVRPADHQPMWSLRFRLGHADRAIAETARAPRGIFRNLLMWLAIPGWLAFFLLQDVPALQIGDTLWKQILLFIAIAAPILAIHRFAMTWELDRRIARLPPEDSADTIVDIHEDELRVREAGAADAIYRWDAFAEVRPDAAQIRMHTLDGKTIILPIQAFRDRDDMASFSARLDEWVKDPEDAPTRAYRQILREPDHVQSPSQ